MSLACSSGVCPCVRPSLDCAACLSSVLVSAVFDLLITNKKKEERKDAIKNEDSENVRAATIKVRHDSSGVDPVSSSINYQGNIYVCKQYYEKIVGWY